MSWEIDALQRAVLVCARQQCATQCNHVNQQLSVTRRWFAQEEGKRIPAKIYNNR
jgi:glutamine synthetase adenylyltransferase